MRFVALIVMAGLAFGCDGRSSGSPEAEAECIPCGGHKVVVDKDTLRADYRGKTYFFCSDACKEAFAKNPSQYAK